jgi:hypothetical protein
LCVGILQKKFNITLSTLHTKGKPEVVNQKITDSAMVKRIIDFKSQSHKHVSNKSKLKVVKKNYIAYENTKNVYLINQP